MPNGDQKDIADSKQLLNSLGIQNFTVKLWRQRLQDYMMILRLLVLTVYCLIPVL